MGPVSLHRGLGSHSQGFWPMALCHREVPFGGRSVYSGHLKSPSWGDIWGPLSLCPLWLPPPRLHSGWIAALSTLKQDHLAVSIIMMVVAGFFTLCAVLSLFLLKRVSGGCWAHSSRRKQTALSCLRLGDAHPWRQLG